MRSVSERGKWQWPFDIRIRFIYLRRQHCKPKDHCGDKGFIHGMSLGIQGGGGNQLRKRRSKCYVEGGRVSCLQNVKLRLSTIRGKSLAEVCSRIGGLKWLDDDF